MHAFEQRHGHVPLLRQHLHVLDFLFGQLDVDPGLMPDEVVAHPRRFVECARNLPVEEVVKFEKWLVNPGEDNSNFMTVQEFQSLPVYQEECKCIEEEKHDDSLPVPARPESTVPHL